MGSAAGILGPIIIFGIVFNGIAVMVMLGCVVYIYIKARKGSTEIQRASDELPKILDSLAYAELPMPIICAITIYFKIKLEDVVQSYTKVGTKRSKLVLDTFQMDPVTKKFLETYPSKFVNHGYVGEDLLRNLK